MKIIRIIILILLMSNNSYIHSSGNEKIAMTPIVCGMIMGGGAYMCGQGLLDFCINYYRLKHARTPREIKDFSVWKGASQLRIISGSVIFSVGALSMWLNSLRN